jgi:SagB-type dehydrogenase family enzyme
MWPESWLTTYFKKYPRFKTTALSRPVQLEASLGGTIRTRHSVREYTHPVTESELSTILSYSIGETDSTALDGRGRRAAASGGARYPIEAYVLIMKQIGTFKPGVYHYDIETHGLTILRPHTFAECKLDELFRYAETTTASCVVIFTTLFHRSSDKYGERAYRHILLEAGGIGAHAHLVASTLGVGCVPMSGYNDDKIEHLLDIDGLHEAPVHMVVLG